MSQLGGFLTSSEIIGGRSGGGSYSTSTSTPTYLAALAQNKAQYANIMAGYQKQENVYDSMGNYILHGYDKNIAAQQGQGVAQDIALKQQYAGQLANSQQQMVSSGLGNSTLMANAARGVGYAQELGQLGINEQQQQNIIGIQNAKLGYAAQDQAGLSSIYGAQNQAMGAYGNVTNSTSGSYNLGAAAGGGGSGGGEGAQPGIGDPGSTDQSAALQDQASTNTNPGNYSNYASQIASSSRGMSNAGSYDMNGNPIADPNLADPAAGFGGPVAGAYGATAGGD